MAEDNFSFLSKINKLVLEGFYYNAGKVRSTPAKIGGTAWMPSISIESQVVEELNDLLNSELDDVSLAIELLLYVMKRQVFIDGNKRTAVIFANHHLISRGLGIISIPEYLVEDYKKMLIMYYEGKDEEEFLKYAARAVEEAMLNSIAAQKGSDSIGEQMAMKANRLDEASSHLAKELGREPKAEELAEYLSMTIEEVKDIMKISLDAISVMETDITLKES